MYRLATMHSGTDRRTDRQEYHGNSQSDCKQNRVTSDIIVAFTVCKYMSKHRRSLSLWRSRHIGPRWRR